MSDFHKQFGEESGVREGRGARYTQLLTPVQSRIFGYIFSLVANSDDAHDLYQRTLLVLWEKFDNFEPGTSFLAWALRVAQIEVLRHRRGVGRSKVMFDEDLVRKLADSQVSVDARSPSSKRSEYLRECVEGLRPSDRKLIETRYERGVQIKQASVELGRTPQSVCNSLRRIRGLLLACVDRKLAEG